MGPSPFDTASHEFILKKPCTFNGCNGIMYFHDARVEHWSHVTPWEWPWYATWVCSKHSAHIEVVSTAERMQLLLREHHERHRRATLSTKSRRSDVLRRATRRIWRLFGSQPLERDRD